MTLSIQVRGWGKSIVPSKKPMCPPCCVSTKITFSFCSMGRKSGLALVCTCQLLHKYSLYKIPKSFLSFSFSVSWLTETHQGSIQATWSGEQLSLSSLNKDCPECHSYSLYRMEVDGHVITEPYGAPDMACLIRNESCTMTVGPVVNTHSEASCHLATLSPHQAKHWI